jgi:tetratricopeptide (TPR) repeat protein
MLRRLALFFLLSCFATTIWAQPNPPSEDKKAEAEAAVAEAQTAYAAQEYEKALSFFTKAYGLYPAPALLFNIAQCYRLTNHDKEALENYKLFLAAEPNTPYAAEVQGRITELEAKLAKEEVKPSFFTRFRVPLALLGASAALGGIGFGVGFSSGLFENGEGCPGDLSRFGGCPGAYVALSAIVLADAAWLTAGGVAIHSLIKSPKPEKVSLSVSPSHKSAALRFTFSGF